MAATRRIDRSIVLVGMGDGAALEARALRASARGRGGVTFIGNAVAGEQDTVELAPSVARADLTTVEGRQAFAATLGLDPVRRGRLERLLEGERDPTSGRELLAGARDELARLFAEAERGERRLERLVLSGHSNGDELWGRGNGALSRQDLEALARLFPSASAQVEDLLVAGCYTGYRHHAERFRALFPRLRTYWAYAGEAPGAARGADAHLVAWERATRGHDAARVTPAAAAGLRRGEHVAVWQAPDRYLGPAAELSRLRAAVADGSATFRSYLEGRLVDEDPHRGPLSAHYQRLERLRGDPRVGAAERAAIVRQAEVALRLRFYPAVRLRFVAAHGGALDAGYRALGRPPSAFARLGRLAAVEEVAAFGRAVQDAAHRGAVPVEARLLLRLLERGLRDLDPAEIPASWLAP